MNDLELQDQVQAHGNPEYVEVHLVAGPLVNGKFKSKDSDLNQGKSKKDRKTAVEPSPNHHQSDGRLQNGLQHP